MAGRAGALRRDLDHRLAAVEIRLAPLCERLEDFEPQGRHAVALHARRRDRPAPSLLPEALSALAAHSWPGNVRELEGVLLRAVATLSPGSPIGAREVEALLSPRGGAAATVPAPALLPDAAPLGCSLAELRRELGRDATVDDLPECGS